jgi:hypothetical protein
VQRSGEKKALSEFTVAATTGPRNGNNNKSNEG